MSSLAPGAEIVTIGGIYGTIVSIDDDRVRVEVADGTELEIAKRAIARTVSLPSMTPRSPTRSTTTADAVDEAELIRRRATPTAPRRRRGDAAARRQRGCLTLPRQSAGAAAPVTLEVVQNDPELLAYLQMGDDYLGAIGYTEHGLRHANLTAHIAGNILHAPRLRRARRPSSPRSPASCHDIGNCVSRSDHWISSAFIARAALARLGMPYDEIATVMNAVGQPRGGRFGPRDRRSARRRHRRQGRRAPDARAAASTRRRSTSTTA